MEANDNVPAGKPTHPGLVLRSVRTERGLTLADVARLTGLPVSTLSKVENDKMSLSYDKLTRISEGLKLDISLLFNAPRVERSTSSAVPVGRRSITRAGEGSEILTSSYRHLYPATELVNKRIIPIIAEARARTLAEFGDYVRHNGEEYAIVLDGRIEFHSEFYTPLILERGDSIYFDSRMGHAYLKMAEEPCMVLSVCSSDHGTLEDDGEGSI
ncbi:XRE family transcriptional regulator [soil metagenome]